MKGIFPIDKFRTLQTPFYYYARFHRATNAYSGDESTSVGGKNEATLLRLEPQ